MLSRASRLAQHRRGISSLIHHAAPLHLVEDDPALSELLAPSPSRRPVSRRPPPPTELELYGESDLLAYQRQLRLEEQTVETAVDRFRRMSASAADRGDVWTHRPASRLVGAWVDPVTLAIRRAQEQKITVVKGGRKPKEQEAQILLKLLPPQVMAVILLHEAFGQVLREANGVKVTQLAIQIANAVCAEVNAIKLRKLELQRRKAEAMTSSGQVHEGDASEGLLDSTGDDLQPVAKGGKTKGKIGKSALERALKSKRSIVSAVNYAAMKSEVSQSVWSTRDAVVLGTALIDILLKTAYVPDESVGKPVPAFRHYRKYFKKNAIVGMIELEDAALRLIAVPDRNDVFSFIEPKHQPMEVRPRPWVSPWEGGYLKSEVKLVRAPPSYALNDALATAEMQTLYDGINALGDTAWMVNRGVLDAGTALWDRGGGVAGLVTKTDVKVPTRRRFLAEEESAFLIEQAQSAADPKDDEAETEHFDEAQALRKLKRLQRQAKKENRELFSQRCDTQYRIDHARAFVDKERFYLPHNVDFRGRAYPVPVFLQHMGADFVRAMLSFAKPGVRLGDRGVYWLKVHLANKLGADKLSFDERVAVAENALPKAIEVGRDPLSDSNLEWWSKHEDPFQLLAVCKEFSDAVGRHGGEDALEDYYSSLPVAMDGSCNGLQHYAALGRDVLGGKQVNLIGSDRPQDVYTGVCGFVQKRVLAKANEGDPIAKLLVGKVTRKVVKQTVMTSVYGVTLTGAREQMTNRLRDIGFPQEHNFSAALMLAKMTMASIGDIFHGATLTMDWLARSAHSIGRQGESVRWLTPVGLPAIQPYRKKSRRIVKTILQRVTLEQHGDHVPVSPMRQRSAFPPNFVHSIDSSHMLLTAIACRDAGLNYAAVHDSFWTNAATVDAMHDMLREEFVRLHNRPLLQELLASFRMRYPDVKFDPLPERGELRLEEVLDSPYFFS